MRLSPLDLAPVLLAQRLRVVEEAGDALLPPAWVVALALWHQGLRHLTVVLAPHPLRKHESAESSPSLPERFIPSRCMP